jgi:sarcosine oxidase subunit gamma
MVEILIEQDGIRVSRVEPMAQWLLHAEPSDAAAIGQVTNLQLPTTMLATAAGDRWSVLHMAPDEWMLLGSEDQATALEAQFSNPVLPAHSMVDISDRSRWLRVDGDGAARLLAGGCPIDLDRMPDATATRTLFGKATIVLWRDGASFKISHARSFDDYVVTLIAAIAEDMVGDILSA